MTDRIMGVTTRYAIRSIGRNLRRTGLSVAGIGIGCGLALFTESLNRGRDELFARMAALSGTGHVRVTPATWRERRDSRLRLADWRADMRAVQAWPGVTVVTPRARNQVLLAMGSHVVPLEMVGVDPATEPSTYRFVQEMARGRYLRPGERGTVVIGKAVADRLLADVDDDIMATAVGRGGAIESMMLRVVGVAATGSEEIDAGLCQVVLEDVESLTGLAGAGELVVMLQDWRDSALVARALAPQVAAGDEVLEWGDVAPEFKGHIEQDQATSRFVSYVILFIVVLGVTSAQLAAVLERRREFAVLSAIGMGRGAMVRLVLQEALVLGVAGAVAGLAIGGPLAWQLARRGLDLRTFLGSSYTFSGVIIEPVLYGDFGPWIFGYVLIVAVGATMAASLYPAWFAARTDAAVSLRVAQ